jgi:hypothetical protein
MLKMLMMATTIHTTQKRKLPVNLGTSFKNLKGIIKSSRKRNTNQLTQCQKNRPIFSPCLYGLDRVHPAMSGLPSFDICQMAPPLAPGCWKKPDLKHLLLLSTLIPVQTRNGLCWNMKTQHQRSRGGGHNFLAPLPLPHIIASPLELLCSHSGFLSSKAAWAADRRATGTR